MRKTLYKFWRLVLPILFCFFLIHFLKDITQDILKISTPLDLLGNVEEDLSQLPNIFRLTFVGLGILSVFEELFLVISIPIVLKRKKFTHLELMVILITIAILLYFLLVTFLDPRYQFWREWLTK